MKNSQLRYCSSPDQLQAQIKRQHDIDIALTDADIICLSCYKTFCKILENPLSLDSNLEELIYSLEAEQTTIPLASIDECVDQSMLNATLAIAKSLLKMRQCYYQTHMTHLHAPLQSYLNTHKLSTLQQ